MKETYLVISREIKRKETRRIHFKERDSKYREYKLGT